MNLSKKLTAGIAAIVGLGTVAFSAAILQPVAAQTPPRPPFAGQRGRMGLNGQERHPELRRSLASLERTEAQLRHSARDFGGHRAKAADLCHQAELEIQQALKYDRI